MQSPPKDTYEEFKIQKAQLGGWSGFDPGNLPDFLFDFQNFLTSWALRKGRAAIWADCGLGKTPMQLVWADQIVRRENKPVLILTPLSVAQQTIREAHKFDIDAVRSPYGKFDGTRIVVTNYERLHHFDPDDFAGVVCDESSCLKDFEGVRQALVTQFMKKVRYRLLCTATASPNDYIELGTSAEALGELGRMDMLARFFKNDENSLHPIWWGARWRFKAHAEPFFWRWILSWARSIRKPSDLGFDDGSFVLPELIEREHVVDAEYQTEGLFPTHAVTLTQQRAERRASETDRCELVAGLVKHPKSAVVWCHLNTEGDLLERLIPDCAQVSGADSDEAKEEKFEAFSASQIRVLVTKPRIGAFGMNWQHCAHMTFFPSHSFEQYYQGVRRCWRFGQTSPVVVDVVTSEGERGVQKNLQRKALQADKMFSILVKEMMNELKIERSSKFTTNLEVPTWL